jgi:hypothetical protein
MTTTVRQISEARERDYRLHLTIYCNNPGCPAREIEVTLKDYDRDLVRLIEQHGFQCPICHTTAMSMHEIQDREEHEREEEYWARCSVNTQLWRRDHPVDPDGLILIPGTVYGNDALPEAAR